MLFSPISAKYYNLILKKIGEAQRICIFTRKNDKSVKINTENIDLILEIFLILRVNIIYCIPSQLHCALLKFYMLLCFQIVYIKRNGRKISNLFFIEESA